VTRLYFDLDRTRIAEKFDNGQTPKKIADDFGTCLQTIVKILRKEGLIPPSNRERQGKRTAVTQRETTENPELRLNISDDRRA
jgi:hypothetical protein